MDSTMFHAIYPKLTTLVQNPAYLLAFAFGLIVVGGVEASDNSIGQVRERIESTRNTLEKLHAEKGALVDQLASIERQYGELANSMRELKVSEKQHERQLTELEGQRRQINDGMSKQQRVLIAQSRAAYASGRQEWLKLALNQEDPSRFSRVLIYYRYMDQARVARLQSLREDLATVISLESQISAETKRLQNVREHLQSEKARLNETKRERQQILAKVESALTDQAARLSQLQEDEQRLQNVVSTLQNAAAVTRIASPVERNDLAKQPEKLARPVRGEIVAQFGSPRMAGRWDGVLIGAPEGTPVRAVSPGRVVFADWLRGYGLLTIIEHGNGVMSLYAFAQSLTKGSGDWVNAGDVIASVGVSGGQPEPGLYFGVRDHGRPIDPIAWSERGN